MWKLPRNFCSFNQLIQYIYISIVSFFFYEKIRLLKMSKSCVYIIIYNSSTIFSRFPRDGVVIEDRSSIVCGVIAAWSIYRWSGPDHANEFIRSRSRRKSCDLSHRSETINQAVTKSRERDRERSSLEIVLGTHVQACTSSLKRLHDDAFICDYYLRSQWFYAFNSETRQSPVKNSTRSIATKKRKKFVCRAIGDRSSRIVNDQRNRLLYSHAISWGKKKKLQIKKTEIKKLRDDIATCDEFSVLRVIVGGTFNKAHVRAEDDVTRATPPTPFTLTRCTRFPCRRVASTTFLLHAYATTHAAVWQWMSCATATTHTCTPSSPPTITSVGCATRDFIHSYGCQPRVLGDAHIRVSRQWISCYLSVRIYLFVIWSRKRNVSFYLYTIENLSYI